MGTNRPEVFSFDVPASRSGPAFTEQSVSFDEASSPTHRIGGEKNVAASLVVTPSSKSTASVLLDTETIVDDEESQESRTEVLAHAQPSSGRSWREKFTAKFLYLFFVSLVVLMLNADQNLIAPSLTEIAKEFNLTDQQKDLYLGGYLSIAFFAFGGVAALLAGYAADSHNRRISFTIVVLIGEISCLCTIFVTGFWGLFVTRLFTGISLGGSYPILFSMIGDTFIDEWRGRASSFLQIVSGGGVLLGQTIAALVAPTYGWRVPFAVVSIPAIAFTVLFFCTATEPKRGTQERVLKQMVEDSVIDSAQLESYKGTMSRKKFCLLLQSKTVVLLLLLSLPSNLPWGFLLVYAQDFLMQDVGKTIPGGISSSESLLVVIIFAISSAIGSVIGGMLTDALWRRRPVWVSWFSAITTIVGALPMFFVANSRMPYIGYCLLVAPSGFIVSIGGIAKNAMLLNCTLPETRGTAFALNTLVDDLGKGMGSFIIAMMIVSLGGRVPAFNVAFGGWILAGVMFALTSCTLTGDLRRKNEHLVRGVQGSLKSEETALPAAPDSPARERTGLSNQASVEIQPDTGADQVAVV